MPVDWRGAGVMASVRRGAVRGMQRAMDQDVSAVKQSINRGNADGSDPSLPGEPPKKVSARLFQSITREVEVQGNDVVGRFGTNVEYGPRLEFGFHGTDSTGRTISQEPRPFLRPVEADRRAVREKYIAAGIKGAL